MTKRRGLSITLLIVVAVFIYASWFQLSYGRVLPGQLPLRISWCGRDYAKAAATDGSGTIIGHQVTSVPRFLTSWPVFADTVPDAKQRGIPCAMVLYLKRAPKLYTEYVLQGGP